MAQRPMMGWKSDPRRVRGQYVGINRHGLVVS